MGVRGNEKGRRGRWGGGWGQGVLAEMEGRWVLAHTDQGEFLDMKIHICKERGGNDRRKRLATHL